MVTWSSSFRPAAGSKRYRVSGDSLTLPPALRSLVPPDEKRYTGEDFMSRSHPLAILLALAVLVVAACTTTTTPGASSSASVSATGGQAGTLVIYKDVSDLI